MTTKQITIHAALGELKKLGQRIDKSIYGSDFIGTMKLSADKVNNTVMTKDDFTISCASNYQSITDLIALRDKIKSAIVLSNATTKLTVGEKEMTVAEAIEYKTSIEFKKDLLHRMKTQYREAVALVNRYNERVEENLDAQVSNLAGKDSNKANLSGYMEEYRKQNSWTVVDPLNLKAKIDVLEEEITDFETNVDVALSISNATTFITI